VENIEEIAGVESIDMLFIEPNDLAASMGYNAFERATTPEVQEASAKVLRVRLEAGKYVGRFASSAEEAAARYRQGFHFVNCGADIVAVTAWMSGGVAKLKSLLCNCRRPAESTNGDPEVHSSGSNGYTQRSERFRRRWPFSHLRKKLIRSKDDV
jgi:4-hydroxy-2-oxoheptanedioate aldolase